MFDKEKKSEDIQSNLTEGEKIKEIYELDTNSKFKKSLFKLFVLIVALFGISRYFTTSYISNSKYAFQINNEKIERTLVDKLYSSGNFRDEEEIAYFILECQLYEKLAEEDGITVTSNEIDSVTKDFPVMQKEVALKNKIISLAKERTQSVTDEELQKMYNDNKTLYADKGTVTYIGVKSSEPLPDDYNVNTEGITKYTKTIEEMKDMGISLDKLIKNKLILIDRVEDKNIKDKAEYRYIYILDKTEESYKSFEDCKELLKKKYDEDEGYLSLVKYINAQIGSSSIIYYSE